MPAAPPSTQSRTSTVAGGADPDGQVVFYLDGAQVGAAGVGSNGSARVPISSNRAGEHVVTAHYLGSTTQGLFGQ